MSNHTPSGEVVLQVADLAVYFPVTRGALRRQVGTVKAVDGVSFTVRRGETLGLVGESGCGKTTVGRSIVRLYEPTAGTIELLGQDITHIRERALRPVRRNMSLVFQDPSGALDPRQSADDIVGEPLQVHKRAGGGLPYKARVEELFRLVGLDPCMMDRVPHEFSGGQRQRLGIARALACNPALIICDEPVSALDVSMQAQVMNLLDDLKKGLEGLTYIFIAHDLSVVRHVSDRVAVMYLGRIVELTESDKLYTSPKHPYTRALLAAVPIPDPFVEEGRGRSPLQGEVPSPLNPPPGCTFHPRCPLAIPQCKEQAPHLREVAQGHEVSCHLV